MKLHFLPSVLMTSALIFTLSAQAQNSTPQPYRHNNFSNQVRQYQAPKPMTEEVLKKRLERQLAMTQRRMAFDKKQADVYAINFEKYQKAQADALKQMMAQAEKQRQTMVKRLEMQQKHMLDSFTKHQIKKDTKK